MSEVARADVGTDEAEVNELNQPLTGISLWKDAWRRLTKNKMAMIGLVLVIIYILLDIFALQETKCVVFSRAQLEK